VFERDQVSAGESVLDGPQDERRSPPLGQRDHELAAPIEAPQRPLELPPRTVGQPARSIVLEADKPVGTAAPRIEYHRPVTPPMPPQLRARRSSHIVSVVCTLYCSTSIRSRPSNTPAPKISRLSRVVARIFAWRRGLAAERPCRRIRREK
jgi:hypothetical protein